MTKKTVAVKAKVTTTVTAAAKINTFLSTNWTTTTLSFVLISIMRHSYFDEDIITQSGGTRDRSIGFGSKIDTLVHSGL